MGGSSWSSSLYDDRTKVRKSRVDSGGAAFAYDHAVRTGKAAHKVHDDLDPKVKAGPASPYAGKVMRESRDSADHPESLAIGVFFDVTGSMGAIPVALEKKLAGLMTLLLQKGYVAHPQILFGAVGDANSDRAPLQVGQFESGVEMDDVLDKIWIEGGGGGQIHETYELAHYFFAHHTSIDCFEKRGKKGYLFTIGDEAPYDVIHKHHVKDLIGDALEADLKTAAVFKELQEKYHVFHIIAEQGSYPHMKEVEQPWTALLHERVLKLEDSDNVAELIAATIALTEGVTDIDGAADDLKSIGVDASAIRSVSKALATYAKGAVAKSNVTGDLPTVPAAGATTRL